MASVRATKRVKRSLCMGATALLWLGVNGCWPDRNPIDGSCAIVPASVLDCRVAGYDGELQPAGLVAYACAGSARPDLDATMSEGVPQGIMCADKGTLESGEEGYCCTEDIMPCAYDGSADCSEEETGYQCWSNNRPESLNAALSCSNGTNEHGLTHYCCTGRPPEKPACREEKAVGCSTRLLGFMCDRGEVPRGENLGANRSRADHFYPICSNAEVAPNPEYTQFCCYMHMRQPAGGTCVPHPTVPGCEPGRYGFACYGPDHPEDNFPVMDCPDPGFAGRSAEGYESTLYCCDFI
jgi:hypothetical protein